MFLFCVWSLHCVHYVNLPLSSSQPVTPGLGVSRTTTQLMVPLLPTDMVPLHPTDMVLFLLLRLAIMGRCVVCVGGGWCVCACVCVGVCVCGCVQCRCVCGYIVCACVCVTCTCGIMCWCLYMYLLLSSPPSSHPHTPTASSGPSSWCCTLRLLPSPPTTPSRWVLRPPGGVRAPSSRLPAAGAHACKTNSSHPVICICMFSDTCTCYVAHVDIHVAWQSVWLIRY